MTILGDDTSPTGRWISRLRSLYLCSNASWMSPNIAAQIQGSQSRNPPTCGACVVSIRRYFSICSSWGSPNRAKPKAEAVKSAVKTKLTSAGVVKPSVKQKAYMPNIKNTSQSRSDPILKPASEHAAIKLIESVEIDWRLIQADIAKLQS